MSEPEILFETRGQAGVITLNRPRALNAVTLNMVRVMDRQLRLWADESKIKHIIITASGDRAFSAGGDIVQLYDWGRARNRVFLDFYREEYRLNTLIKRYPKPYIALIDGIVMGGGVGVSINGSHRVVTQKVTFAMPETGIGLFPDVGGTYFLPRCPGETGMYLGLTGARLKAPDTLYTGLATHYAPSARLPDLLDALCAADDIGACLDRFAQPPEGEASLAALRHDIDRHFGAASIEAVLESLAGDRSGWAQKTAKIMAAKSPTSLAITYRQLRAGKTLSFEDAMKLEFRIVNRIFTAHDFFEGTRAVVIDKDNAPKWQPASLDEINSHDIEAYFAPLEHELDL